MNPGVDPSPKSGPSRFTKILVWIVGVIIVLGIAGFVLLQLEKAKVASRLEAIRARGEPVSPQELTFAKTTASSQLQAKAQAFREGRDASADFDLGILALEIESVRNWAPIGDHITTIEAFVECALSQAEENDLEAFGWDRLIKLCLDPKDFDQLSECQRLGFQSLGHLREPLVPIALELCAGPAETSEASARDMKAGDVFPPPDDLVQYLPATEDVIESLPALFLENKFEQAMQRLQVLSHGARSVSGLPWMLGNAIGNAVTSRVLFCCRLLLATSKARLDWHVVRENLQAIHPLLDLERGLVGERAFGIRFFQALHDGSFLERDLSESDLGELQQFALLNSYDFGYYLDELTKEIERSRLPLPHSKSMHEAWSRQRDEFPRWAIVSMMMLPPSDRHYELALRNEADLRLAAVAIEANENGIESAIRLAARSVDPFDGKPLRTRVDGDCLVLWSIGFDWEDQGGSTGDNRMSPSATSFLDSEDLVWRVRLR